MLYTNTERDRLLDEELAALEAANKPQEEILETETPETLKEPEADTWKERYSNLQSYSAKQNNELKNTIKELETKVNLLEKRPTESSVPTNVEEMRQWVEDYPELASILKTMMKEEAQFVKEELGAKLDELENTKRQVEANRAFQAILKVHPDFGDLVNSAEFHDWISRQPEEKGRAGQAMLDVMTNGFDSDEAIKVINIYKRELAPAKKKDPIRSAAETVSRSVTPEVPDNTNGKRQWKESEIEKMSMRDYDKFEADIDAAKREGRFVYDITGAAR